MRCPELMISKLMDEQIPKSGVYSFINPYSYELLSKRPDLVSQLDGLYIDGELLVKLTNMLLNKSIRRQSFDNSSLAPRILQLANENRLSIYFIGGEQAEIESFISRTLSAYPDINLVGYSDGFSDVLSEKTLGSVIDKDPDIVVAGLGTPLQEEFLVKLKLANWNGLGFSCGGYIRQAAKFDNYFPNWSNKLGLRWLVRLFREPHVFSRLVYNYPINLMKIFADFLRIRLGR